MPKEAIAWDSCIIIDAISKTPTKYPAIQPMVRRAEANELWIVVSMVSVAEVLYLREFSARSMSQEEQNDIIEKWFDNAYLLKRNADFGICQKAAEYRRQFEKLTPADSIILATAAANGVSTLVTYDNGSSSRGSLGLLQLDGKLGPRGPRIVLPEDYSKQTEMNV